MTGAPTYREYLRVRGFESLSPLDAVHRMLVECWFEAGFHRFWRLWSPLAGFALFRLYLLLGGRQRRVRAVFASFAVSGLAFHDVPLMIIFGEPIVVCTIAWLFYAGATLVSSRVSLSLPLPVWPVVNFALVATGLWLGVVGNSALLGAPAAQQAVAADAQQLVPIDRWYRSGGGRSAPALALLGAAEPPVDHRASLVGRDR
jgi:hypothetical protein